jgi:hypothetical protein
MKKLWILPIAAIMMVACGPSADDVDAVESMMGGLTEMVEEAAEEATEAVEAAAEAVEEAVEEEHEH